MNYLKLLFDLYLLKNNIKKSPEQIKKMQERKLRKILEYAYRNSVYYRRKFEACGIMENNISNVPLERFPTTNKKQLLENFDELVTVPDLKQDELRRFDEEISEDRKPFKGRYHVVHSSGSTGKPGYFVYDKQAWNSMLLGIIRAALWDMTMPQILRFLAKGPQIVYIAATDGRYGGAMAVGDGIDGLRASQLFLDIKTPLSEWVSRINEFKPNMIIGYPSAIKILGELAENGGIDLNIFRIISCGEPLGAGLRNYLESIFNTDVINFYGASESLALGVENSPEEGMILFDDMNVIEVRNGNMYLTSLYNFAQPLIRFGLPTAFRCKSLTAAAVIRLRKRWDFWVEPTIYFGLRTKTESANFSTRLRSRAFALRDFWIINSDSCLKARLKCLRKYRKMRRNRNYAPKLQNVWKKSLTKRDLVMWIFI